MFDAEKQQYYTEGVHAFQSARGKVFWQDVISLLRGKPAELWSFEEIKRRLRLREERYKGLQDVPLDRIVGSVGRYRDFSSSFLPKREEMRERWSRVYAMTNSMEGVPPIELYQIDDVYFVRDGNHRVSVARQLGTPTIEAHVTELPTTIDLEPGMSYEELEAAEAYAAFLDTTRLDRSRPHHISMQLSNPTRYVDLLAHIYLHQLVMEHEGIEVCNLDKAASDWYDNVLRPAVTLIRKYEVMQYFPGRTEADLYLWLVEHLAEVKELYGEEAKSPSFSNALTDLLSQKQKPIPQDLREEQDHTVNLVREDVQAALEAYRAAQEKA